MTGPTFHDDYKNSIIIIPLVVILVIFSVEVPILQNIDRVAKSSRVCSVELERKLIQNLSRD